MSREATSMYLAWLLAPVASCGGSPPSVDAPAGNDLTIELFQHVPFVEGDTDAAPMVAVQDGDTAWIAVTADSGVYRAHLSSDRYGVAIGCRAGDSSSVRIVQRTVSDGVAVRARSCGTTPVELDITVKTVPTGSNAFLSTPAGSAGGGALTYAFFAQPGPAELFASLSDSTGRITKIVRPATFDLQARKQLTVDFANEGVPPEGRPLEVAAPGEQARVVTSVIRPTGEYLLHAPVAIGAPGTYQVLPASLRRADDLFGITVTAGARSTRMTSNSAATLAFQLPLDVSVHPPEVITTPFVHPAFSFETSRSNLAIQTYTLSAHTADASDAISHDWTVELSASWLAAAQTVRYEFPDLSAIEGFSPELALFDRGPIRWSVRRTETSAAADIDGRVVRTAIESGAIESYCGNHVIEPPEACDPPEGTICTATCTKPVPVTSP